MEIGMRAASRFIYMFHRAYRDSEGLRRIQRETEQPRPVLRWHFRACICISIEG